MASTDLKTTSFSFESICICEGHKINKTKIEIRSNHLYRLLLLRNSQHFQKNTKIICASSETQQSFSSPREYDPVIQGHVKGISEASSYDHSKVKDQRFQK